MILIGQYDSPFVRRVAVTLRLYGIDYEHRSWSVWKDAERIAEYNPLRRVPVLLLDDGSALLETFTIVDALDELAGERALVPRSGPVRRTCMRLVALSTGLADKAVSLLYEGLFRSDPSARWVDRCRLQIADALRLLERERGASPARFFFGDAPSHADVALGCTLRFLREAHPSLFAPATFPALAAHADACESLPEFAAVVQPIVNNV